MKEFRLYESEYRLLDLIWREEPLKSTELVKLAFKELEWKKSTCYTVLKKLETKGFVQNEKAVVTSLVVREQVQRYESEALYRLIEDAVAGEEKESGRKGDE